MGLGLFNTVHATLFRPGPILPTRELADQVAGELSSPGAFCLTQNFNALRRATVRCAARFPSACAAYHCGHAGICFRSPAKGAVSLDALQTLVMDEANSMLDMGFSDAINKVIRFAPAST
ncbi:DEAD/DEAH box helicase [Shigella flexneri]